MWSRRADCIRFTKWTEERSVFPGRQLPASIDGCPFRVALTYLWMLSVFHRSASSCMFAQGNSLSLKGRFLNLDASDFPPVFSNLRCSSSLLDAVRSRVWRRLREDNCFRGKKIYMSFFPIIPLTYFSSFYSSSLSPSLLPFPLSLFLFFIHSLIHTFIPYVLWTKIWKYSSVIALRSVYLSVYPSWRWYTHLKHPFYGQCGKYYEGYSVAEHSQCILAC